MPALPEGAQVHKVPDAAATFRAYLRSPHRTKPQTETIATDSDTSRPLTSIST